MNDIIKVFSCLAGSNCIVSTPNAFYIGKNGYSSPIKLILDLTELVSLLNTDLDNLDKKHDEDITILADTLEPLKSQVGNILLNLNNIGNIALTNRTDISNILLLLNRTELILIYTLNNTNSVNISSLNSGVYRINSYSGIHIGYALICKDSTNKLNSALLIGDLKFDNNTTSISWGPDYYDIIFIYITSEGIYKALSFIRDSRIEELNRNILSLLKSIKTINTTIDILSSDTENLQNTFDNFNIDFNEFKNSINGDVENLLNDSEDFNTRIGNLEDSHINIDDDTSYPITPNKLSFGINIIKSNNYKLGIVIASRALSESSSLYPTCFLIIGGLNVYMDETYDSSYITLDGNLDNFIFVYKDYDGTIKKIDMRDIYSILYGSLKIKSGVSNTFGSKNIKAGRQISIYNESGKYLGYILKYNDTNIFVSGFIDINLFSSINPDLIGITESNEFVLRLVTQS